APVGGKFESLDVVARAIVPRVRRALSLSRILGLREADVQRHLRKHEGDSLDAREIIIGKPINLGLQQLVYRAPSAGRIAALKGNWTILDLDGKQIDVEALYRGTAVRLIPDFGVTLQAQGAVVEGIWGSGHDACGVLKMTVASATDTMQPESLDADARGTIVVAGASATQQALERAESVHALGVVVGSLPASLKAVVEKMELAVLVTEGFGHAPMATPIFELLRSLDGHEACLNGSAPAHGGTNRPELFIPQTDEPDEASAPALAPLQVKPGARVRIVRQPYLGRTGTLPDDLPVKWTADESGVRTPSVQVELQDAQGTEQVVVPWANVELIG
ncbi:MAG: hypothetical protein ACM3JD_01980, partial [Rudaea sp.]